MATRGWGGSIALAVGVAAGAAAAQLGLGYGLGVLAWTPATDSAGERAWLASLAWATWIAATATVLGAVVADRLSSGEIGAAPPRRRSTVDRSRPGAIATSAWRTILALSAGIGGLLTVPLVAIPARAAHRPDTFAPQMIAGGYAVVGVVVGLVVAIAALSARAVASNVVATTAWLWALAIASVVNGVAAGTGLSTAQLAIWRFGGGHFLGQLSLPGAALMMGIALVVGVLAAWPATARGDNRVGVAISGGLGPLMVAAAYFLAGPKLVGVQADEQLSAYLIAPYAVLAGLAGSVLLVAIVLQREQRAAGPRLPGQVRPDAAPDSATSADDEYAPARAYHQDGPAAGHKPAPAAPAVAGTSGSPKAPLWPAGPVATDTATATGEAGDASASGGPQGKRDRASRR